MEADGLSRPDSTVGATGDKRTGERKPKTDGKIGQSAFQALTAWV
jgi:hypothetical protein